MANLRDLAKSMRIAARAVDKNSVEAVKSVSLAVGTTTIYATPVDTSRARMNWQTTLNQPAEGVLLAAPAKPASPSDGPTASLGQLRAVTAGYNGQEGGVWIANNLPYIQELNNGSSEQAPANFVAKSVMAGLDSLKNIKLLP